MKTISTISNLLKSSGILSALIISGAGFSAYAQNEGKIVFQSANPESGSYLTKLKDVYFTFDNPYGDVLNFGKNMIEITDGDGNVTKTTFRNLRGQIYFRTSTAGITTPGTYSVKVLADAIGGLNKTDYTMIPGTGNDEINLEYTVVEASPVAMSADLPEDYYNITSLKDIRLDLTGGYQDYGYNCDATEGLVTVTGPEGTSDLKASLTSENGAVMLSLDGDVDVAGTYSFIIPANALSAKAPDGSSIVGTESGEIKLSFNYTSGPKVVFQSVNPVSGTYLTKLKDVYFTFDNPFGDKLYFGNNMIEITDPEGNVTKTKFRNQKGQIFFRTSSSGFTAPGTYTVNVLPGAIGELNTADYTSMVAGTGNELITLVYNVVEASPVTFVKSNPANESKIFSIDKIYLTLAGCTDYSGYVVNMEDPTLNIVNAEGTTVATAKLTSEYGMVMITADTPVTELGDYTITIPEGAFSVMAPDGSAVAATQNAEAITLKYSIVEYCDITFSAAIPSDNSQVDILKSIQTSWKGGNAKHVFEYTKEKELITVTNEEGEIVSYATIRNVQGAEQIKLTTPVDKTGKYQVNIPAGIMWPMDLATYKAVKEYTNEAVTLNYEVIVIKDVALLSADPANGSTVAELSTIVTEWEGGVEGSQLWVKNNQGSVSVTTEEDKDTVVTTGSLERTEDGKILITLDQPVKTDGNYIVTIDAMSIYGKDGTGNYSKYNKTVKLNYIVDVLTGVNTITIDQDNAVYYTLDGVKVDGNLSKGTIYIRIADGKAEKFIAR